MGTKTADMNLEKEKLEIIKWVRTIKDDSSIERLKMLRDNPRKVDWWNEITNEEKAAIDKGLADIKGGRVRPHKEARKLYEKWL
jgi:predicted transcriptional regulator